MLLHIMTSESTYHKSFINFVERNFPLNYHTFVFRTKKVKRENYSANTNILIKSNFLSLILFIPSLIKSEKIYLHYLPYGPSLPFWALYSMFSNKLVWVYWGGDIYSYKEKDKDFRSKFYEVCRKIIIRNLKCISGFLYQDYEVIKKVYRTKANYTKIIYPLPVDFSMLERVLSEEQAKGNSTKRILTGNSADPSNNHLELFSFLEKYKDEEFEIICPLSYGPDKDYTNLIIKEGNRIFGYKFKPLTQFLNPVEYSKILVGIDVAVMNHQRQQGLGNLISILWLGKKVFVRSDTTSYSYFKSEGMAVWDTIQIQNISFNDLISIEPYDAIKNKTLALDVFSDKHYKELWNNLFSQK